MFPGSKKTRRTPRPTCHEAAREARSWGCSVVGHRRAPGRGVLVGAPYRHQLAIRVVDGPGAAAALGHLADHVRSTYAVAPGPVTPLVHWVHEGLWRPASLTRGQEAPLARAEDQPTGHLVDPGRLHPEVAAALGI